MIFYHCNGNELAPTQADAKALDRDFTQIDVPTDKAGLMAYINDLMRQVADNEYINDFTREADLPGAKLAPAPVSYADHSVAIDDNWDQLPLARKLHFAALAMEDARTFVKETPRG